MSYREAKNRDTQLQVLAELNSMSRVRIIGILVKNGEKVSDKVTNQLYKRLDVLDAQISEREREYREIVRALNGGEKQEENHAKNKYIRGYEKQ